MNHQGVGASPGRRGNARPKQNRHSAFANGRFCRRQVSGAPGLRLKRQFRRANSGLGLTVRGRGRTRAVLGHERVELFLVLGVTQPIEEILEFGLLLFEALQGLDAVFVEGAIVWQFF
jgi:hypothetical protein